MLTPASSGSLPSRYVTAWQGALACFVVAGSTGVLYRVGLLFGLPGALEFDHVRHAHSHLMYFGWVTPAIMALIAERLPPSRRLKRVIYLLLGLSGLAYVPFLLHGYGLTNVGSVPLPLSVILATANMIGWYVFVGLYVHRRSAVDATEARRFWDAALTFLVVSSLGAWGLGLVQMLQPARPVWFAASLHLFLDLFADGWLLMAVLGFAIAALPREGRTQFRWSWRLLVTGLPVTFLLGVPVDLLPPSVRLVGSAGAIVSAAGLALFIGALGRETGWTQARMWRLPLGFLTLKIAGQIGLAIPPVGRWGLDAGLRIPYLHVALLGVVTLGLLAAAGSTWGTAVVPGRPWVGRGIVVLLVSLIPLTGVWPAAWSGVWIHWAALGGALVPVLAMAALLGRLLLRRPFEAAAAEAS